MTTDKKLILTFGIISFLLLITLLFKLTGVPGGMILSGLFLGGMMIVGIILGCLILSGLLRLIIKRTSFLTILFITTSISFLAFHYQLYSPTLKIKVPNGYKGEVNLVLSNVDDNILIVDSNGTGYLNEWTFNKAYSRPIVEQMDGKNLDEYLIGFSPSTFFGKGKSCCVAKREIQSLSFKIGTQPHLKDEYFQSKSLTEIVDKNLAIFTKLDQYSTVSETSTK
ncbi:hypothetical protein [Pedobacter gandavensis]|uniref:hypothetical protein n=1 Tax=Pedobacter gandavensis TaxID=2679963 RepID=UPI00293054C8|nr:hypothetical protein [Pedobacter gandavensis]